MMDLIRQCALRSIAAIAFSASLAASPAHSAPGESNPRTPTIRVLAAWIRWLPAGLPAAGYLTLTNTGDKALGLETASSPSYRDVSIHRSITHGSMEEMTPVKEIILEPHQTLEFESTGYHLMLMQPAASADTSVKIPITLRFSDGSSLTVPFEVRKKAAGGSAP
ncbi:MAG: copper chaperone PCu(A)C [Steroidobacteraceae bacterium]|jgi:copper(I)-binding protein